VGEIRTALVPGRFAAAGDENARDQYLASGSTALAQAAISYTTFVPAPRALRTLLPVIGPLRNDIAHRGCINPVLSAAWTSRITNHREHPDVERRAREVAQERSEIVRVVSPRTCRAAEPESHRTAICALRSCSRLFATCGSCDRGRRYCSRSCSASARRSSVRRAGQRYQASERGRGLHAIRQARYRERRARVTHHGPVALPGATDPGGGRMHATAQQHGAGRARAATPEDRRAPPDCALCGRNAEFLRWCFRRDARPRAPSPALDFTGTSRVLHR